VTTRLVIQVVYRSCKEQGETTLHHATTSLKASLPVPAVMSERWVIYLEYEDHTLDNNT
jgi:hypothetical protein